MRKQSRKPVADPAVHGARTGPARSSNSSGTRPNSPAPGSVVRATSSPEEEIDGIVTSQAGLGSAWTPPIKVKRFKAASLYIPGELAARATFLATLHREKAVGKWVERVLRERIELEEFAFAEAKKKLAS